jgi:hypothetical protein
LPVIFLASEITSRLLCAECGVKSPLDAPHARRVVGSPSGDARNAGTVGDRSGVFASV